MGEGETFVEQVSDNIDDSNTVINLPELFPGDKAVISPVLPIVTVPTS